MGRLWRLAGFAVLMALVLGLAGLGWLWHGLTAPAPEGPPQTLIIGQGQGAAAIGAQLQAAGLVRDRRLFRLAVKLKGAGPNLRAGEFRLPGGLSARAMVDHLLTAQPVQHKLTVAEGLTSAMIHRLVADAALLSGPPGPVPAEGSLLPETYFFTRGTARQELLKRMAAAQAQALSELWPMRDPGLPVDSPEEAVILASIVEKETAVPDERARVAAVFVNRLNRGMRLQSDPTVIYAVSRGDPLERPLSRRDLRSDDPYNTYRHGGLPPGPIANPGRAAIEAVLRPARTAELYFVADGQGGHAFATTLEEHNRNVADWRRQNRDP